MWLVLFSHEMSAFSPLYFCNSYGMVTWWTNPSCRESSALALICCFPHLGWILPSPPQFYSRLLPICLIWRGTKYWLSTFFEFSKAQQTSVYRLYILLILLLQLGTSKVNCNAKEENRNENSKSLTHKIQSHIPSKKISISPLSLCTLAYLSTSACHCVPGFCLSTDCTRITEQNSDISAKFFPQLVPVPME